MSAVTGVSAVLNYIYKGSGQALRGLFGRPLHARTVPTVSASDRLSTIAERWSSFRSGRCARIFEFLLRSHSVPSDISDPAADTAPTANEQVMACSVSRSTHGRRHATTGPG